MRTVSLPVRTVSLLDIINGSVMRDIKLAIISGEFEINVSPNIRKLKKGNNRFFNKGYWKIIRKHKHNCILTGSAALMAFGLIDRMPNDIDLILIPDNSSKILLNTLQRGKYIGDAVDLIGSHRDYGYTVDFFEYKDSVRYIEKDGYKLEHPFDILSKKVEIMKNNMGTGLHGEGRSKDYFDVHKVLQKLNYVD